MELRLHVHRVHWIHLPARLFRHLDRSCFHVWTTCCLDLALQVHSERRRGPRHSFLVFTGLEHNWLTRSKGGCCAFGYFPLHLCCSATNRWRYRLGNDAQMVTNHWYFDWFRPRCRLLLRWRNSRFNLDRCCPIMRNDRWFDHLVRGGFESCRRLFRHA